MASRFRDRTDAGQQLAGALQQFSHSANAVVLGLPRGGIPVAYQIAHQLGLPLDVVVVRKVGAPGQPELAMGAVASGGARVVNDDAAHFADAEAVFAAMAGAGASEVVRREALFRAGRGRSMSRIASASSSMMGSRPVRPWKRPCAHCGCWAQRA